jgi:hypothetical protein
MANYANDEVLHRSNLAVTRREERLRVLEYDFTPGGVTNTNSIIRFSQTGLWQHYPFTVAGMVQCLADTVANDTIDVPVGTLAAPGGAWVINPVEFRVYGHSGMSTFGGTLLQGDWALSNQNLVFQDLTLTGTNFEEYATFFHCTVSFNSLKVYDCGGGDNALLGSADCLVQSSTANFGLHSSKIVGPGANFSVDSGIFVGCWFVNTDGVNRSLISLASSFMACKFYGLWNITTAAGAGNYAELHKCHLENVSIANAGGALFNDTTWGTITNRANIDISEGDRSVYDITGHATSHASDIAAGVLLRHLPAPSLGGNIAIDSGAAWVSHPITGDATLTAGGALTVTGIGGVPSSAFWLLAGRVGGQIGYGGTGAGDDAYIRSTSNAAKGTVFIADDGGDVQVGAPVTITSVTTPQLTITNSTGPASLIITTTATTGDNIINSTGSSPSTAIQVGGVRCGLFEVAGASERRMTVGDGSFAGQFFFDGGAGYVRDIIYLSGGVSRWALRCNNVAESGANVGSDFNVISRDDAGAILRIPLQLYRSSGQIVIGNSGALTAPLSSLCDFWHGSTGTNDVITIHALRRRGNVAAAAGYGLRQRYYLRSSTTDDQIAADIEITWTDATHASRTALLRGTATGNAANNGYFGHWNHDAVSNSALTIIPNATGDVTYVGTFMFSVYDNTNATSNGGTVTLNPGGGAVTLLSDGTDILQITCAADGSVTIIRSAGTHTFRVAIWGVWF